MIKKLLVAACALVAAPLTMAQAGGIALGVSAGTLGIGLDATYGINERLNIRASYHNYDYGTDLAGDGNELDYEGDLALDNFGLTVDFHPFAGAFRISAGLQNSDNGIAASGTCNQPGGCEFGSAGIAQGDSATAVVDMSGTHPYVGIGWGNAVSDGSPFGVIFDIGVMLQGEPDVTVTASCAGDGVTAPSQTQCEAQAANEEQELQEDVEEFDLFPVVNLGLRWRFN